MEAIKSAHVPAKRINVIDALRGFALLGVILIHMLQYFGYSTVNTHEISRFPLLDRIVQILANNIIAGRFINIFSFLFGLSFFIQMDRASKKGIRSEEHTSELQSRPHLVCRLLLEKK